MIRKIACYLFRAFSFFQVATFTATWLFYGTSSLFLKMRLSIFFRLTVCFFVIAINKISAQAIRLNQLGYYTYAQKIGVVTGTGNSNNFYLIKEGSHDTVYAGTLSSSVQS